MGNKSKHPLDIHSRLNSCLAFIAHSQNTDVNLIRKRLHFDLTPQNIDSVTTKNNIGLSKKTEVNSTEMFNTSSAQLLIFSLLNCLQEHNPSPNDIDQYGRFKYTASLQYRNNSIRDNTVQDLINQFLQSIGIEPKSSKTQFFISHDIDFLYGSKKEDLKWAIKNWRIGDMLKIMFQEAIRRPHWRNIDKLMTMNDAYDIKSTFFWLVNEGIGIDGVPNADYNFMNESNLVDSIQKHGGFNGLHKSASTMTFDQEIHKSGQDWQINRNHYLKFQIHEHWKKVSESSIKLDCSLGFPEHYGFRNSYGKPFAPYDLENNRPYDFVEAPLHIMDATFLHYLKTEPEKIGQEVINFIEKNKQDCVLSILWHNNYCTDYYYKPFLKAYKEILGYIYEHQFETITPEDIIKQYSMDQSF